MTRFGPETIDRLRAALTPGTGPPPASGRPAAVLVPLYVSGGEVHLVLTKKSERVRSHTGQVAFPGGGFDRSDGTLLATALREASEEVGIQPQDVEVLGALDDLPTATSGYVVRPFVGVIPHADDLRPDGFEVERVLRVPLSWFCDPGRWRDEVWERGGERVPMRFYDIEGTVVWGLTARIIGRLLELAGAR